MRTGIDLDLIQSCKKGDHASFEKLFYLCKDSIYNLALRFTGNQQDAGDITQEAFVRIYFGLKDFRMESSFSTWIYRITVNLCIDFLRSRKRGLTVEESVEIPDRAKDSDPLFLLTQQELASKVQEAFQALAPDERLILTLRVTEGLPYKDISSRRHRCCKIFASKGTLARGLSL